MSTMLDRIFFVLSIALLAILAVYAGNQLYIAKSRTQQKRTMADLRTLATVWEAYAEEKKTYSIFPRRSGTGTSFRDFATLDAVTLEEFERAMVPTYVRKMPRTDGWGNRFELRLGNYDAHGLAQSYVIRSVGRDHEAGPIPQAKREGIDFDDDIYFSDGVFITYPEGL